MILTCLIIPKITGAIPNTQINLDNINIPHHLRLADPSFNMPGEIDLLLGAERFWSILCVGQFILDASGLMMRKTKLGWIVEGPINATIGYRAIWFDVTMSRTISKDFGSLRNCPTDRLARRRVMHARKFL